MENKSHAIAAGTFVLALLAVVVALAVWLTRDTRALRFYELSSADTVTGLQPEASVRFKGVNVGKVTAIGFDPVKSGHVLIRIAVDDQAPVTQSTFASLGFQGVTGLAFIQLDDTGASTARLPVGQEPPARIPLRPGLMSQLSERGLSILSQLDETSRRLNTLLSIDNQKVFLGTIESVGHALVPLAQEISDTLQTMKDTSERVGDSADEARASAKAFKVVTERMNASGGTLDKLAEGVDTLASTGQTLNSATLPHLNRAAEDGARAARRVGRTADTLSDNPKSLLFGNGTPAPGPGEPGFSAKALTP
jgi:phospholipid/cholesterol/gamma-HCH transport system substrate-binding protein